MYNRGWQYKDKRGHNCYKYKIPNSQCVEYSEKKYKIDPYVIGCFIGDGCCLESRLVISSMDEELVQEIAKLLNCNYKKLHPNNYSWGFYNNDGNLLTKQVFSEYNKELVCSCHEKRIPIDYLLGSKEQRLHLLQGLMDTDGYTGNGGNSPNYSTVNKSLAEDVAELARSLGFYTTIYCLERPEKNNIEYTVNIFTSHNLANTIFRLSRKHNRALEFANNPCFTKHNFVTIKNIELLDYEEEMTCIYVDDPEHLYLTNNFIVTHNTRLLTERIRKEAMAHKGMVVAFTFTNAAAEEMNERLSDLDKSNVFIGTIHSYCYRLLIINGIEQAQWYVEEQNFDKLFVLIKSHLNIVEPVYSVLCDEMQDCSGDQFEFIFDVLKWQRFFAVYDKRQSIYRWRDAHPEYINDYVDKLNAHKFYLNQNYRNGWSILDFAKGIITLAGYEYKDFSDAMCSSGGKVIEVDYNSEAIARTIKKKGDWKKWFVLTRTNDQLDDIKAALDKHGVPTSTFKRNQLTNKELQELMHSDTVKVLTIHTSKGLENDYVVVIGAKFYNLEEKCVSYVAATRARKLLVWTKIPPKNKKPKTSYWET